MSFLDIIVLVFLVWFGIKGFSKGLIIELATLAALILGVYMAYFFSDIAASFLLEYVSINSKYVQPVSFVLVFVAVIVLVFMLAKALEALIKTASLGFFNKLAGAFFGMAKIALICGFCLIQISYFDTESKIITSDTKQKSITYKPLTHYALAIVPLMKNIKEKLSKAIDLTDNKKNE